MVSRESAMDKDWSLRYPTMQQMPGASLHKKIRFHPGEFNAVRNSMSDRFRDHGSPIQAQQNTVSPEPRVAGQWLRSSRAGLRAA